MQRPYAQPKVDGDGKAADGTKYCIRGLEKWVDGGAVQEAKRQIVYAVLDEQDRLWMDGVDDRDERLAAVYSSLTVELIELAGQRAQMDFSKAKRIYLLGRR